MDSSGTETGARLVWPRGQTFNEIGFASIHSSSPMPTGRYRIGFFRCPLFSPCSLFAFGKLLEHRRTRIVEFRVLHEFPESLRRLGQLGWGERKQHYDVALSLGRKLV